MKTITAFIGVIGSGKDYRAESMIRERGCVRIDFKDALIEMCSDLLGYDIRPKYDAFKNHLLGLPLQEPNPLLQQVAWQESVQMQERYPGLMTGRKLLQRLGTDVMRKRDPEYWVNAWKDSACELLDQGKDIVCADCRFENEILGIIRMTGYTSNFIFCDYRSGRYDACSSHASERMAQKFLECGYKDGQTLTPRDLTLALGEVVA